MKDNFKKFQKIPLFLSTLFLIFSCFVFFFLYRETGNNIVTSEQMETVWQNEAEKREELKFLNSSLKTTSGERALLESYFIRSSDIVPFLDMIEKLALGAGAKAEVVLVDIPKDNSGLIVELGATGSFETIYKFLTLLENSPYELDFISVDIKKTNGEVSLDGEESAPGWSARLRVKLLSFIQ